MGCGDNMSDRNIHNSEIPYLHQYFGVWACYEPVFRAGFDARQQDEPGGASLRGEGGADGQRGWAGDAEKSGYGYGIRARGGLRWWISPGR